jgi:phosphate transport system protein
MTLPTSSQTAARFFGDVARLKQELTTQGQLVASRVSRAIRGLVEQELDELDEVAIGDVEVNAMQMTIDDHAFKLLALYQPVAIDLRVIVAAMKINSDLERVGDLAVNLAEAARRYLAAGRLEEESLLSRMTEIAESMLGNALQAFVTGNVGVAQAVLERDDALDSLRSQAYRRLADAMMGNPAVVTSALEVMLMTRHLERIGDHATNIAEEVFFVVAGEDVRHQATGVSRSE